MIFVLQVLIIVALAPLVQGAMKSLRARLQGRPGPSPLQPYRDLAKLWQKEALLPEGVSSIAVCAPGIALGVSLTFAAMLPIFNALPALDDVVALVFLLALGRFFLALAALDSRSAFAGMAASREMTFASLVEPTLLTALLGAAALLPPVVPFLGSQPLGVAHLSELWLLTDPRFFGLAGMLGFGAFFLVLLAETARIPIDNQETHYELTMIHEGLALEYSGWQLAFLQIASYVRQFSFLILSVRLLPLYGSWVESPLTYWLTGGLTILSCCAAIAVLIVLVETAFAKLRLFEVPQLLGTALILAATSVAMRLLGAAL